MLKRLLVVCILCAVSACSASAPSELLPTATIQPTPVTPTATPTFLPPPTVTPFPTATPGGVSAEDDAEADPTTESDASSTEAAPEATQPSQPTATSPPTTNTDLPEGVNVGQQVLNATFEQGWPSEDSNTARYGINNNAYTFVIGPFDGRFINSTVLDESDYYAQVEATPAQCPAEAGYGLFFRYEDSSNYYALTIFCDGTYRLVSRVNGTLSGGTDGTVPGDPSTGQTHLIGVLAQGNTFRFFFDGEEFGSFTDDQLTAGDVAVYALAGGGDVLRVTFDNLQAWLLN